MYASLVHDGARPAPIVVGELRQIPVGHDALGSVEKAQPGDAKPDRLDHARVPAHLDHIPYPDQALEEDEKARDDVLDEALGAEAHSQPEHTGRDCKGADIHAHFLEHHDAHHEGQRVEGEILEEGGEGVDALGARRLVGARGPAQHPFDELAEDAIGGEGQE